VAQQIASVKSPCIGVCVIDSASGFCSGCLRSLDEIMVWRDASDGLRRAILDRIHTRPAAGYTTVAVR